MKHEEEKVLTEAATSNQDKAKPLYEDLSISELVLQVISVTVELIRVLGEGERFISVDYDSICLAINDMKRTRDEDGHTSFHDNKSLVWAHTDTPGAKEDLLKAYEKMSGILKSVQEGNEDGEE